MFAGQKFASHCVAFLCAICSLLFVAGFSGNEPNFFIGLLAICITYYCVYKYFEYLFIRHNQRNKLESDKANHQHKGHGFGTTYLPDEKKFILVGLKHEDREAFIRDNIDEIEARAVLDRKQFADKDPNVVGLALDGTVCGFISKQYAQFIAPVIDQFGDDILITPRVWTGENGKLRIYMKVWARKKEAKEALAKAFEQCDAI